MKPVLLTVLCLVLFAPARASFLVDPTGGTVLWNDSASADDVVIRGRSLGFTFTYLDDEPRTTLDVSTNGNLNAAGDASYTNELTPGLVARIAPLWDDLAVIAGSGDSITEITIPGKVYAVTWRVHQSGIQTTRHAFQVALFGGPVRLHGIDFVAGDIAFSYEAVGASFWKDAATVGLDLGAESSVVAAAGTDPDTGILTHASAIALPTGPGGFILFRRDESDTYQATTHINRPPQPVADTRYFSGTNPITLDVLANDLDPDGNPLTLVEVTQGTVGEVAKNPDGRVTYTPGVNFAGTDNFTYTVRDPFGLTDTARVSVLPFSAGKGVFDGLLTDLPGDGEEEATPTPDGVGSLRLALAADGSFTGTLVFGSAARVLRGAFDASGNFVTSLSRVVEEEKRTVTLTLHLDLTDAARPLTGIVTDGVVTSRITASRSRFHARLFPAPQAGFYTALFQPEEGTTGPEGIGYAHIRVNASGTVKLAGRLSDGRKIGRGTRLKADGTFALHTLLPLKKGLAGSISGLVRFDETALTSDLTGALQWFMPDSDTTSSFEAAPQLLGARYRAPRPGQIVLPLPTTPGNASIDIGAGMTVRTATITPANRITIDGALSAGLQLSIKPPTGMFSGSMVEETFDDPPKIVLRRISGVFVTKAKSGGGFYLKTDGTSVAVTIGPPAP